MDLKKKLEFYRKATNTSSTKNVRSVSEPQVPASVRALAEHFGGTVLPHPQAVVKISHKIKIDFPFSSIELNRLTRNQFPQPISLDECLFFDLETTGLSGGAGTYPFLFGLGYFEQQFFKIEQYFLPDFGRDYYVFKEIAPLLQNKGILVSFNGKSYDFPLLKSRAILNRLQIDFERFQHLDLLHLVRRVWKDSQESCDLVSIEREQLQFQRTNDLPGSLIPVAYSRFVQSGVIHEMIAAIQHNHLDILSLQKILFRLASINQSPASVNDVKALLRLARLAFELEDFTYFEQIERQLQSIAQTMPAEFLRLKSLFCKKLKRWEKACAIWENLSNHPSHSLWALEELAKTHEHILKNPQQALQFTHRALKVLNTLEQLNPYTIKPAVKQAFLRRFQRLKNKI